MWYGPDDCYDDASMDAVFDDAAMWRQLAPDLIEALDKCEDQLRARTLNGRTRYEHDVLQQARTVLDKARSASVVTPLDRKDA